jgi:hypothetical protein
MTQPLGDQFHVRAHVDVLDRKRVSKAMWAEGMRELFVLLRPFGQGVHPAAQRRVRASEEVFLAVLHLSRQGL